ncbi:MAG: DMT family transporter [Rubricoccaceae bacterium]|nr:DMT family transporter [Rubricoccaceae bacterium]
MADRSSWRYDAALLLVVLIWGLNFPVIKVPLLAMHPFTVNLFRFCVSVVVLGALWGLEARRNGRSYVEPVRQMPGVVVGLGLVGHVGYQVLFILAVARTSAGSAALIIASSPMWTALIGHALGIDRMQRGAWGGLLLSTLGVAVVVLAGEGEIDFSNEGFLGNVLMLIGAVLWAVYTVFSRPALARGAAPLGLAFYSVLVAFPVLAALGVTTVGTTAWARVDAWTWAALVFSGGLSTGLAYYLWNLAVRRVGPSQTAAFSNLVPFVALVAAFLLLGEPIRLPQVLGGALIVGGLVLMRRRRGPIERMR